MKNIKDGFEGNTNLIRLKDELIKSNEQGDLEKIKILLSQIPKPEILKSIDQEGLKKILGAAVWGMRPDVLRTVLDWLKISDIVIPWKECEEYNLIHYGAVFVVSNFSPKNYEEWYDLLQKINFNPFLRNDHLKQVKKAWHDDSNLSSWDDLKRYVIKNREGQVLSGFQFRKDMYSHLMTEASYQRYKIYVKGKIEALSPQSNGKNIQSDSTPNVTSTSATINEPVEGPGSSPHPRVPSNPDKSTFTPPTVEQLKDAIGRLRHVDENSKNNQTPPQKKTLDDILRDGLQPRRDQLTGQYSPRIMGGTISPIDQEPKKVNLKRKIETLSSQPNGKNSQSNSIGQTVSSTAPIVDNKSDEKLGNVKQPIAPPTNLAKPIFAPTVAMITGIRRNLRHVENSKNNEQLIAVPKK